MITTLTQFIEEASYCFVKKSSLLSSMFKTGQSNYDKLSCEISILGMYFWLLRRIGMNYAITETEVTSIMAHILHICGRTNVELPDGASVIGGSIIGGGGTGTTTDIPVVIYTMNYSGVEEFQVTVNHNLNKFSPVVIVTDTSGINRVRVYPAITEISVNQLILDFVSTSSGIITVL